MSVYSVNAAAHYNVACDEDGDINDIQLSDTNFYEDGELTDEEVSELETISYDIISKVTVPSSVRNCNWLWCYIDNIADNTRFEVRLEALTDDGVEVFYL